MKIRQRPFRKGRWNKRIDIQDFINCNYKPYESGPEFLATATERTCGVWKKVCGLFEKERAKGGVLDIDTSIAGDITSHKAGYIDAQRELIVGLQSDKPLRRTIKPKGGYRLIEKSCEAHGYKVDDSIRDIYTNHYVTHNDAVFAIYTDEIRTLRKLGLITGLPDNYARGRIIGDSRRIALYGITRLIEEKTSDMAKLDDHPMDTKTIRLRMEVSSQIKALKDMIEMGSNYGLDLSRPAETALEAIQWTYMGYLAAVKQTDGAAMSFGNMSSFFDVYIERDLNSGRLTEIEAQELIDDFVIKLRMIRHLRPPEYDQLFAGDPTWVTVVLGGMGVDGRTKVTKTDFRILQSFRNLGPAPEPNMTILYSLRMPAPWKQFVSEIAIETSSLQFENDDLMRPIAGDDYGISCCVSLLKMGSQMQYFGARCNLPKALLLALNEGRDEINGETVVPGILPLKGRYLDYDEVHENFAKVLTWLVKRYVQANNIIHSSHDAHYYESALMALLDTDVERFMAFGVAGLSVVVDSLCAIRYAKVEAIRKKNGLTRSFKINGTYPAFGNDDARADNRACDLLITLITELRKHPTHRRSNPTLSVLTITSNVLYGKKTGATPDGRKAGEPFAPGANPMYGREKNGALCSLNSVSKLPYFAARDGISNTFSIVPAALGKDRDTRIDNLTTIMEGYFSKGGHHLNINVLDREMLEDAIEHPEKYPQLTIRVSGYAVHFTKLSRKHQEDVLKRTFHSSF